MSLPEAFCQQMNGLLGKAESDTFFAALKESPPVSIRLHPLKSPVVSGFEQVPWCPYGRYLPQRPVFTLDPAFHAGAYYVQEASSMVIWEVLRQVSEGRQGLRILDLCAAPGGKTTLIADLFQENCLVIANEVIRQRAFILRDNVMKSGYANIVVTQNTSADWGRLAGYFDIILVDAPCSGEGMFRKDPDAVAEWSTDAVEHCALRQKDILRQVLPSLKAGGVLIYSTCTYNTAENEGTLRYLTREEGLGCLPLTFPKDYAITERADNGATGYQFYPHKTKGEGFFVSAFRKPNGETVPIKLKSTSGWQPLPKQRTASIEASWCTSGPAVHLTDYATTSWLFREEWKEDILSITSHFRVLHAGVAIGEWKKDILIPHHNLALSPWVHPNIPLLHLSKEESLHYLKKEPPASTTDKGGWHLVACDYLFPSWKKEMALPSSIAVFPIGWAKQVGHRFNNYLPQEWRIRMDISSKEEE